MKFFLCVWLFFLCCDGTHSRFKEKLLLQCHRFCMDKPNISQNTETTCSFHNCSCDNIVETIFIHENSSLIPQLLCKEDTEAYFTWNKNPNNQSAFFMQYWSDEEPNSILTHMTSCNFLQLSELTQNTKYHLRFWELSFAQNIAKHSGILELMTVGNNIEPSPSPKIEHNLTLNQDRYEARITWLPNKEFSCNYQLVYYGHQNVLGAYEHKEIDILSELYNVTISDLEFGSTYTIDLMAKGPDGDLESAVTSLTFKVPSCLDTFNNLTKCIPEPPKNVQVVEKPLEERIPDENFFWYSVTLNWDEPELHPDFYLAHLLRIDKVHNNSNSTGISLNVSGDQTSATFSRADVGLYYQVSLNAWSLAGSSGTVVINRHMTMNSVVTSREWTVVTVILVVSGLIFIALVSVSMVLILRRQRAKKERVEQRCKYFANLDDDNPETDSLSVVVESDEWELDPRKLQQCDILGEGAFGIVKMGYLVTEDRKEKVAIKMLKDCPNVEEVRQFCREIEIMKSVEPHPNIVSMLGCVTVRSCQGPLLVVEYCSLGNLQVYLREAGERITAARRKIIAMDLNSNNAMNANYFSNMLYEMNNSNGVDALITQKQLLSIARQVAMGMEHLARTRVVHRDLAARNVLVCDDQSVKVSDFGLSRDVYQDNVYCKVGGGRLPIKWMALESLTHQTYTTSSDVWSFGILLWEIATLGATPYAGVPTQELLDLLKSGTRLDRPADCSPQLYNVMTKCWAAYPKDRPTFSELRTALEDLLENESEYINFSKFDANKTQVSEKLKYLHLNGNT